jgi:hypothetical protein
MSRIDERTAIYREWKRARAYNNLMRRSGTASPDERREARERLKRAAEAVRHAKALREGKA